MISMPNRTLSSSSYSIHSSIYLIHHLLLILPLLLVAVSSTSEDAQQDHHQLRNRTSSIGRSRRAVNETVIGDLPQQPDICKAFVTSKNILRGSKAASPADIFNELPIGRDFASGGRKYAREYAFQSPGFPNNYPNNIECIKLIVAPSPQHRIILHITRPFAIEPDSLCSMDFFEVRDGAYGFSPLIGRFCSRLPPPEDAPIRSTSRFLWLRFRSDNTLPHAGFRAVFHFEKLGDETNEGLQGEDDKLEPTNSILRRSYTHQFDRGEEWTLNNEYLISQLEFLTIEDRKKTLEAVFDIRSNPGTHILLHVNHFQVPIEVAWSCDAIILKQRNAINFCATEQKGSVSLLSHVFNNKAINLNKVKGYTQIVPDPDSELDGRQTFLEVYASGNTIAESSPPCPSVDRFCIFSATSSSASSSTSSSSSSSSSASSSSSSASSNQKGGEEEQQQKSEFIARASRLVIRMVVAKPSKYSPTTTTLEPEAGLADDQIGPSGGLAPSRGGGAGGLQTAKVEPDIFAMLPNFTFTLTSLSQTKAGSCHPDLRACDDNYCVHKSLWCDGTVNCPQGRDEGDVACNPDKVENVVENAEETADQLKEKDKAAFEKAQEDRADFEKHAAIIGSISLVLIVVTAICMFFAIRRKRKEASHHRVIEIKLPPDASDYKLLSSKQSSNNSRGKNPFMRKTPVLEPANYPRDIVMDMSEINLEFDEDEDESNDAAAGDAGVVLSTSGDPLLGFGAAAMPSFALTNSATKTPLWQPHAPLGSRNASSMSSSKALLNSAAAAPAASSVARRDRYCAVAGAVPANQYSSGCSQPRGVWQSDVDLVHQNRLQQQQQQHKTPSIGHNRRKLYRGDSSKTADGYQFRESSIQCAYDHNSQNKHNNWRNQPQNRYDTFLRQKPNSVDMPEPSQETIRVPKCRMMGQTERPRPLVSAAAASLRLFESRDCIEYETSTRSSSHCSSDPSPSSSPSSDLSDSSTCSSASFTQRPQQQQQPSRYRYENLQRIKSFRSMPDVNSDLRIASATSATAFRQLAVSCGHKDCRDYYRMQVLTSELGINGAGSSGGRQTQPKRPISAAAVGSSRMIAKDKGLFRETEIELEPSSEEDEDDGVAVSISRQAPCQGGGGADAYSVHGLSDAISVDDSSKSGAESYGEESRTRTSNGSDGMYSSNGKESPAPVGPPSRAPASSNLGRVTSSSVQTGAKRTPLGASANTPDHNRCAGVGGRLPRPTHPTAPSILVYEYEA